MRLRNVVLGLLCGTRLALAGPLMTEEYPLWVQDAVRTLRQRGLVSAGCLPQQALSRSDMGPLLQQMLDLNDQNLQQRAGLKDLKDIRLLLESILEGTSELNRRIEKIQPPVLNE